MFSKKKKNQQNTSPDSQAQDTEVLDLQEDDDADIEELPDEESAAAPKKKLPAWVIVPVLGVLVLGAWGASAVFGQNSQDTDATALNVSEVTTGTVKEVYNASGTIESENTKTYYSPVSAPITNCNAVVGKAVKNGDLLITFDTTNLERDNQQAQLTLQSSLNTSQATRAQNAKTIEAANAASAETANAANDLAAQVNNLKPQVDAAYSQYQANLAAAGNEAQANQQKRETLQAEIDQLNYDIKAYQSIMESIETGYSGRRPDYDELVGKLQADPTYNDSMTDAERALLSAFETYDSNRKKVLDAQTRLEEANNEIGTIVDSGVDDAGYAALQAQYDSLYAQWQAAYSAASGGDTSSVGMTSAELANLDVSDNLAELSALTPEELLEKGREGMKADMDGVIASVDALQSNTASQGMAMFTIASMENVRVKVEVSPDDYEKMKIGNAANITIGDHQYNGTLTYVNRIALNNEKGNPVIDAQIHISNPDDYICIGATAKVSMTVSQAENVLLVPTETINASSDGDFVYVIENGVVAERPVELGTSSATQIEIKSGLKEGDLVVNDFNTSIVAGMKATPVQASEDDAQTVSE